MAAVSLETFLEGSGPAILVEIETVKGSSPREKGAFMLVSADSLWDTIGGGQLEYIAVDHARLMLVKPDTVRTLDIALGPEIGQCCGGRLLLRFSPLSGRTLSDLTSRLTRERQAQPAVFVFGAGHVGKALAEALMPLPLAVTVVESRQSELRDFPATISTRLAAMPEALVSSMPAGAAAVIVTHDHALDFLIAREALTRADLAYVGMIGSATKKASFFHWMRREGVQARIYERLTLPIGGTVVKDKRPQVIAAMVAAELLCALASTCEKPGNGTRGVHAGVSSG